MPPNASHHSKSDKAAAAVDMSVRPSTGSESLRKHLESGHFHGAKRTAQLMEQDVETRLAASKIQVNSALIQPTVSVSVSMHRIGGGGADSVTLQRHASAM